MAELFGRLRTIPETVTFLREQQRLLRVASSLWSSGFQKEGYFIRHSSEQLSATITRLESMLLRMDEIINGVNNSLLGMRFQYPIRLKPGEFFDSWTIAAGSFTVVGARGRIANLGTDTNSRLAANAIISVVKAKNSLNNGIFTLTGVTATALQDSTNPWTADTEDTTAIVHLIETA